MKKFNARTSKPQQPGLNYGLGSLPPYSHPQRANFSTSPQHRIDRVETPQQRRRREIQAQTQQIQQVHLRDRLRQRLLAAEQRGDLRLIRQLRREWDELFPETPGISEKGQGLF